MDAKEIALELLEKYKEAEESNILEYSSSIDNDMAVLEKEIQDYRDKIESI